MIAVRVVPAVAVAMLSLTTVWAASSGSTPSESAAGVIVSVTGHVTVERPAASARTAVLGMRLDPSDVVIVERGAGVRYRALCTQNMLGDYSALARGDAEATAAVPRLASGAVTGLGKHTTDFQVDDCNFYLVISALKPSDTLVWLRVRA
jgi:hypothetical protein